MTNYRLLLIRPEGYTHADALAELVETLQHGLTRLGHTVTIDGRPVDGEQVIVFGAHLADEGRRCPWPADAILFNTEQMTDESSWCTPAYLERLASHRVWDYSARNVERLRRIGVTDVTYVPIGYVPELTRIVTAPEDIDVLFYGSINDRREAILAELRTRGLNVIHVFGQYGAARDALIARAKVVLNMHYYESRIFEIVRVSYLLANRKAVVAECDEDTEIDPDMRRAVLGVPYTGLVDACAFLCAHPAERAALAERGFRLFTARRQEALLASLVTHQADTARRSS